MRLFFVLLLLQSCTTFAQPLTLKIDAITSKDTSEKERVFTINYQLKNNTDNTLNFSLSQKRSHPVQVVR
jgi:hypothetical protein